MIRRALLLTSGLLLSLALPTFGAQALVPQRPAIKLQLSGELLVQSGGKEVATPLGGAVLKKGDLVRYTIVASNGGAKPAVALMTVGPVPARTAYVAGSASRPAGASVEFSLDGKAYSARPTVPVKTASGVEQQPASPDQYSAIRWTARVLAPKHNVRYTYEVRVK